jgi:hypothetical protein
MRLYERFGGSQLPLFQAEISRQADFRFNPNFAFPSPACDVDMSFAAPRVRRNRTESRAPEVLVGSSRRPIGKRRLILLVPACIRHRPHD